jgi:4-alpha-glucanotransferase
MNEQLKLDIKNNPDYSHPADIENDALHRLAKTAGLSVEWIDAFGTPQIVNMQTLRIVLQAMQLNCGNAEECEASIALLAQEELDLAVPPLITAQVGVHIEFSAFSRLHGLPYRILFEHGDEIDGVISVDISHPAFIPAVEHIGYHRLYIGDTYAVTLAVAPPRCFSIADAIEGTDKADHPPALWALAAQLYSLRREDEVVGDAGVGDFAALDVLAAKAATFGASAIAISPVHAMFSANPYQYSPYSPSSRLFFNVLHIDPAAISGQHAYAETLKRLDLVDEARRLQQCELVDWPAAGRWKLTVLRDLFDHFDIHNDDWKEFEKFRIEGGVALEDHARFEALDDTLRRKGSDGNWRYWPAQYQDPRSDAVALFAADHANEVTFHAFLQWQAARGLQRAQQTARTAGMQIGLITDLAVGAEGRGSQAWSRQNQMLNGISVGAPPDLLGPRGQNWGLAAFSPRALRRQGFQAYIEMLRAAFHYAGGVRIDHILGLARMWLVPTGADGRHGVYLRYPFQDLMRLIALESYRYKAIVIGEDLGTVPAGFSEALADAGLMGIRVLWFEQWNGAFKSAAQWSPHAIATTDTHDLPTVAGWWHARDVGWRIALDLLAPGATPEQAYEERTRERTMLAQALGIQAEKDREKPNNGAPLEKILAFIGSTPAPLVIIPLEDILALDEQPNLPNTTHTHPNWQRRLPLSVNALFDNSDVQRRLAILGKARAKD